MERQIISSITKQDDVAKVMLTGVIDTRLEWTEIFNELAKNNVNIDMIVCSDFDEKKGRDLTFTIKRKYLSSAKSIIGNLRKKIRFTSLKTDEKLGILSISGIGMRTHPGIAAAMFRTLANYGINIKAISTSEIKISVLIEVGRLDDAFQAVKAEFSL
jgi:aspartate kinase